ncbi:MAG TPA: T9SS type A sorting domain-containing protein [Bacteroidia bacterium]|jgi:hypothetical protein|nr:T9SS type A sorting domain-containing protein [Bacteroidia bacterium]
MRKQILFLSLIFISIANSYSLWAQSDIDTITFEKHLELVKIDTSQKNNIWQIGRPQKAFFDSAYSKPNAIVTDTINDYPVNNVSSFNIILPGTKTPFGSWDKCTIPVVTFWQKFDMDTLQDSGSIDVSSDMGKTWQSIYEYECSNSSLHITGHSSGWESYTINFTIGNGGCTNYFPACDTALLRFTFYSGSTLSNKEGWMIDNIVIGWDMCEGVQEYTKNAAQISAYPNPSSNNTALSYQLPQGQSRATLKLYNAVGELVKTGLINSNAGTAKQDVTDLPNGIYYYTLLVNGTITATSKLVVIH